MKVKALILGSTAGLLLSGAAFAQEAAQPAAPAQAPAQPAAATPAPAAQPRFSDDEVQKFADIMTAIDKIRADHAATGVATPAGQDPAAREKMAAAVQNSGLAFETYNAIAARMDQDKELNGRIARAMKTEETDDTAQ